MRYMLENPVYFAHLHNTNPTLERIEAAYAKMSADGLVCAKNVNWRPVDQTPRKSKKKVQSKKKKLSKKGEKDESSTA